MTVDHDGFYSYSRLAWWVRGEKHESANDVCSVLVQKRGCFPIMTRGKLVLDPVGLDHHQPSHHEVLRHALLSTFFLGASAEPALYSRSASPSLASK